MKGGDREPIAGTGWVVETVRPGDQPDWTEISEAQRAMAFTV
jgi:hypothetical protein